MSSWRRALTAGAPSTGVRFAGPRARARGAPRRRRARGMYLADRPVLATGRVELLWYLREQSISFAWHRYGNLSARDLALHKPCRVSRRSPPRI